MLWSPEDCDPRPRPFFSLKIKWKTRRTVSDTRGESRVSRLGEGRPLATKTQLRGFTAGASDKAAELTLVARLSVGRDLPPSRRRQLSVRNLFRVLDGAGLYSNQTTSCLDRCDDPPHAAGQSCGSSTACYFELKVRSAVRLYRRRPLPLGGQASPTHRLTTVAVGGTRLHYAKLEKIPHTATRLIL